MKKSLLLGLGAVAMAFAAGAGISKAIPNQSHSNPTETQALSNGYYLCGSVVGWVHESSYPMTANPDKDGEYVCYGVKLSALTSAASFSFQMFSVYESQEYWTYGCVSVSSADYISAEKDGNDAKVNLSAGQLQVLDIYVDTVSKNYHFAWGTLTATVGGVSQEMTTNPSKAEEFTTTFTAASYGDAISVTTSQSEEISFVVDSADGNNISATKRVVCGGTITFTYNKYTSRSYMSGFASSDHNLYSFSTGFLTDTISESTCNNPVATPKSSSNVWDYYYDKHSNFNGSEKSAFQDAVHEVVLAGISSYDSYDSKLQEAACRYVLLLEKFGNAAENPTYAFSGVNLSAALKAVPTAEDNNRSVIILVVCIGAITLASMAAFAFRHKRKEE